MILQKCVIELIKNEKKKLIVRCDEDIDIVKAQRSKRQLSTTKPFNRMYYLRIKKQNFMLRTSLDPNKIYH